MPQSWQIVCLNVRSARPGHQNRAQIREDGYVQPAIPAPAPRRLGRSPRDMALSLLVLLVPIFILIGVYRFLGGESPTVVDPSSAYQEAQVAHAFPVAEPAMPGGWTIISADFRRGDAGGVLRIGFRS